MRPFLRWSLFTFCLAVFMGAMLWISARTLDLEEQRRRTAEDAEVQEKMRLALWRMDSLAGALLIRENARPAWHYQTFYAPDDVFTGKNQAIPKGQVLMPSPLLGNMPDLVQLHFELLQNDTAVCSPQAPAGNDRDIATNWYAITAQLAQGTVRLAALDMLLKRHPEIQRWPLVTEAAAPSSEMVVTRQALSSRNLSGDVTAAAPPGINDHPAQLYNNRREQEQRSDLLTQNIVGEKLEAAKTPLRKTALSEKTMSAAPPILAQKDEMKPGLAAPSARPAEAMSPAPASAAAEPPANPNSLSRMNQATAKPVRPTLAGDLRTMWLEGELLLLRRASLEGRQRLQGVWLDWPKLRERLLETVRDLLPSATLQPVSPDAAGLDAGALVTLPVRLLPGAVPVSAAGLGSPLKPALVIAWACLFAAALAIAFVLQRAIVLSERRGAFVSAVTHELRTPLTTFQLYSEMLADDMVPDAAKRREYLNTLCTESTRLTHLVENVLAYSRIERGRTAARQETLRLADLMRRIEPRLRQRAREVDMQVTFISPDDADDVMLKVDPLAVEQILFNLTDNACKYAAPACTRRVIEVHITALPRQVEFRVCDHGPGLSAMQLKKLFQPFAKSATEAAHSAPGVGLGLALCRRLARELSGTLELESNTGGACFCLTLPRPISRV